jgi:hypothetical protein
MEHYKLLSLPISGLFLNPRASFCAVGSMTGPDRAEAVQPADAPIRAALYFRVSTRADKRDDETARRRKRQELDNQRRQFRQICEAALLSTA